MKTKEELYKWFFNKFDLCYVVIQGDKDKYYMYYDTQFIRQKKLSRVLGKEIVYPEKPNGTILFEQDWENKTLWCDYDNIWSYLELNYSNMYQDIKELISWMLQKHDKLRVLTMEDNSTILLQALQEHDKLRVLTPTKMRVLEPKTR